MWWWGVTTPSDFIETPSLGKLPSKAKDSNLAIRDGYSPPDANPAFQYHGDVIIIIMMMMILSLILLLLLLLLLLLSLLLLLISLLLLMSFLLFLLLLEFLSSAVHCSYEVSWPFGCLSFNFPIYLNLIHATTIWC